MHAQAFASVLVIADVADASGQAIGFLGGLLAVTFVLLRRFRR